MNEYPKSAPVSSRHSNSIQRFRGDDVISTIPRPPMAMTKDIMVQPGMKSGQKLAATEGIRTNKGIADQPEDISMFRQKEGSRMPKKPYISAPG